MKLRGRFVLPPVAVTALGAAALNGRKATAHPPVPGKPALGPRAAFPLDRAAGPGG